MVIQWLVLYITLLNHGKHAHMIRLIVIAEENTDLFSIQKKKKVKGKTQLGCSSLKRGEDPQQGPTSRGLRPVAYGLWMMQIHGDPTCKTTPLFSIEKPLSSGFGHFGIGSPFSFLVRFPSRPKKSLLATRVLGQRSRRESVSRPTRHGLSKATSSSSPNCPTSDHRRLGALLSLSPPTVTPADGEDLGCRARTASLL
jgi:hypothetical protein